MDDTDQSEDCADGKSCGGKNDKETGSYTNTHKSGPKYPGKGDEDRAAQSGKEKADKYNDPLERLERLERLESTDWKRSTNEREAFKDEAQRLRDDGGHRSDTNYNRRASPGERYGRQDGDW